MDITHSIRVHWGLINTSWKENFMQHAWKLLFSTTWSDLDREENVIKRGSDKDGEGDDDDARRRLGKPLIEQK
jgi:hypothetical protein